MTHKPPDDPELVSFLKHHRPLPPPASISLEERIMQATQESQAKRVVRPIRWWATSGAVAAGLVVAVAAYQASQPAPTDVASLEAFMENSWLNSVSDVSSNANDRSAQEFLALVEPLTDN
ncbi:MAG: hypothetical protein KME43_15555 [Myxacorys chilensis ATA2-1-KO14]|jgi:hypothetical protein|nr:hypothetical protein [Myxacorys chilensis ATA2-1-KO14]